MPRSDPFDGGLLARTDSSGSAYYHADGSGNITAMMNGIQNITARYEYGPFGRLIGQWGPQSDANRYRFSSKEAILPTDLYYYGHRFYNANLQRWMNRDPIGEAGGMNLAEFIGNDPVNFVDPYGLTIYYGTEPLGSEPLGAYGPYAFNVNDGSDAVLPAVPYWTDSKGLQSADLDFLPAFPEIPALGKVADALAKSAGEAVGDAFGNLGRKLFKPKTTECPKPPLTGPEAARAALGKGPNAVPGAPLTPEMRSALQQNLQAAQNSLNQALQGLNVAGNPIEIEQAAIQAATAQSRISEINAALQSGAQAPKN